MTRVSAPRMKALMIVVALSAFVAAPALALLPEAEACQPYQYYCPIDGHFYWACGSQIPPSSVHCVLSVLEP